VASRDDQIVARVRSRLGFAQGRRDTEPDLALGQDLARRQDAASVGALVSLLSDRAAASGAIKAIYECGYLAPDLLAPHAAVLLGLLASRNNRMVWGGAIALSCVAAAAPDAVWPRRAELMALFPDGSVITRDHVVRAMAHLARSSPARERALAPWLLLALEEVRPVNLPRWAEDVVPVLSGRNRAKAMALVEGRLAELSKGAQQRVRRLLRAK